MCLAYGTRWFNLHSTKVVTNFLYLWTIENYHSRKTLCFEQALHNIINNCSLLMPWDSSGLLVHWGSVWLLVLHTGWELIHISDSGRAHSCFIVFHPKVLSEASLSKTSSGHMFGLSFLASLRQRLISAGLSLSRRLTNSWGCLSNPGSGQTE